MNHSSPAQCSPWLPPAGTYVYKAFNCIGVEHMAHPGGELITGERLTMLFAGPPEHQVGRLAGKQAPAVRMLRLLL